MLSCVVYGVAFDFFNVSGGLYVDQQTSPEMRSSAQGLFMIMTNGIGASLGTWIAGTFVINKKVFVPGLDAVQQLDGWRESWFIFAAYALLVAVLRRPYPQLLLHGFHVQKGALGVGDGYAAPVAESAAVYGLHRVWCMRSERRDINAERLRKIAVAAMKQSLKALLPRVDEMTPLTAYLAEAAASGEQRFVGYCDADTERRLLARAYSPGAPVRLLIGPEGDFAPEEIAAALRAGYAPVTMGDNRLRTETAALTACDTIHIVNQLML